MTERYQAPSVRKAFQILQLLARSEEGMGISDLAQELDLSKSTVHGITAAMEEVGAVIRNPLNKRYTLGYTVVELGKKGLSRIPLREVARTYLENLAQECGESVFLGILKDHHIFILDVAESNRELKITSPSGTKIPLTAGAPGKLFLAGMEEKNTRQYLAERPLVKYTDNTIIDTEAYLKELEKVRGQGYATDYGEYLQGVNAVSALIDTDTLPMAAIWVVGFSSSLTASAMPSLVEKTMAVARAISQEMRTRTST
jgi:DNA-binding IclR family transcriptional regulator